MGRKRVIDTDELYFDVEVTRKSIDGKDYLEKRLENWLFKNLHVLEDGLEGIAQQYRDSCLNCPIDILAKDKNNLPVLIEVKICANHLAVRQVKLYLKDFSVKCRAILVAFEFSDKILSTDWRRIKFVRVRRG